MSASDGVTNITSARGALASVETLARNGEAIMSYENQMDGQSFGSDLKNGFTPSQP